MTTRKRIALFGLTIGIIAACGPGPTELCACTLPGPFGVAFGTVTAGGAPVAGARIHAVVLPAGCTGTAVELPAPEFRPATAADGSYELHIGAVHPGDTNCVRVVAERGPGDSAFTQVDAFDVHGMGTRTRVDIAFP
jgi:hypothetical protein